MTGRLVELVVGPPPTPFLRAACSRGLPRRVARRLEAAARELAPDEPLAVLASRELFERAAMQAVVGDAGNLELSFGLVDRLASAVETLQLARASDVPDPFRRVWVQSARGTTRRGVVLRHRRGEIAVFCPPGRRAVAQIGETLHLRYRGFGSAVSYELRLNDAVRLPGAHVLHLTRLDGQGAIGRDNRRWPVDMAGRVRELPASADAPREPLVPCRVLDVSLGGVRLASERTFQKGQGVAVEVELPDGAEQPLAARAEVRWVGGPSDGGHEVGVLFDDLPERTAERLARYLERLAEEEGASPDAG